MGWKGPVLQSPPPLGGDYTPCLFTAGLGWVGGDCSSVPGMYYHPRFVLWGVIVHCRRCTMSPHPFTNYPPPSRDFSGISIRWGVIVPRGGWLLGGGRLYIFPIHLMKTGPEAILNGYFLKLYGRTDNSTFWYYGMINTISVSRIIALIKFARQTLAHIRFKLFSILSLYVLLLMYRIRFLFFKNNSFTNISSPIGHIWFPFPTSLRSLRGKVSRFKWLRLG